ncbi:hypothetical protein NE237_022912 [Protea cynaroides]|uniref:Ser/Thr-rich protein T10 in DGCR region n=1 Tax=Protea cynaroides TaxID=273540 RepID=A0A9Q0K683_9MAGN|nr:hypothetical protein NE237_022912 [Protea cynaroides]
MCIAAFIWQAHPLYEFLLLLNRDEYHNRPTKSVSWWKDSTILGGRDELAGGTWLACTREGRLAFLTNVLELHPHPEAKSRGDLPVRFLESRKSPMEFAKEVGKEADQYNGFNLILADVSSKTMVYVSNRPKGQPASIEVVSPGIHVLSNARLDSPWHKAERLGGNFKHLLGKYGKGEVPVKHMVEDLMRDTVKADESRLPHICSTEWEKKLSSIFVEVDTPVGRYGTRSTVALSLTANGEVSFYEMYLEDETWKEQTEFKPYKQPPRGMTTKVILRVKEEIERPLAARCIRTARHSYNEWPNAKDTMRKVKEMFGEQYWNAHQSQLKPKCLKGLQFSPCHENDKSDKGVEIPWDSQE